MTDFPSDRSLIASFSLMPSSTRRSISSCLGLVVSDALIWSIVLGASETEAESETGWEEQDDANLSEGVTGAKAETADTKHAQAQAAMRVLLPAICSESDIFKSHGDTFESYQLHLKMGESPSVTSVL